MWELDYKESWTLKNWCFWTVVLEKTLESPLDCKEIQPVHPKGYQSWVFIGRTDVEAETPILWPLDAKSWLIGKDPDVGKDWRQEETVPTENEMVGWDLQLNGHEFGWTPGVGDGQGGLACCSSWACKELDTTEQLNWTELGYQFIIEEYNLGTTSGTQQLRKRCLGHGHRASMLSQHLQVMTNLKALSFWVFMEDSLPTQNWLDHQPLVIEPNLQPLSPPRRSPL